MYLKPLPVSRYSLSVASPVPAKYKGVAECERTGEAERTYGQILRKYDCGTSLHHDIENDKHPDH